MKKNNVKGFSLIEMLIVVVIIGIIAAIAIPGYLASKRSANEGSAVSSIRMLHTAQMTYSTSFGEGQFAGDIGAGTLNALNTLRAVGLIDESISSGSKSGFNFVGGREATTATAPAEFFFSAIPVSSDTFMRTGDHRFGIATDGAIRADATLASHFPNSAAVSAAPPYGN